jgi:hypothetical protein
VIIRKNTFLLLVLRPRELLHLMNSLLALLGARELKLRENRGSYTVVGSRV